MNKKVHAFIVAFVVVIFSVFLFGCKHETIKFYRESAATTLIDKFKGEEASSKKSNSGVIILKDENYQNNNNINFGPRDINFDMPVRFK